MMWILIVTTIWAITGGVKAENIRVFDDRCLCEAAKALLELGHGIETHSSDSQTYSCIEVKKP